MHGSHRRTGSLLASAGRGHPLRPRLHVPPVQPTPGQVSRLPEGHLPAAEAVCGRMTRACRAVSFALYMHLRRVKCCLHQLAMGFRIRVFHYLYDCIDYVLSIELLHVQTAPLDAARDTVSLSFSDPAWSPAHALHRQCSARSIQHASTLNHFDMLTQYTSTLPRCLTTPCNRQAHHCSTNGYCQQPPLSQPNSGRQHLAYVPL